MGVVGRVLAAAVVWWTMGAVGWSAGALGWTEREVVTGEWLAALRGVLTLPQGAERRPGVLILAGSGPVDRDGNAPGVANDSLKLLAHGLADAGVISLRVDKRGVGASRWAVRREDSLRLATYADDAATWLDVLRAEPLVSRVFVLGHSEGALVGTLAAQRRAVAGVVLLAGAGERIGAVMARQLAAGAMPAPLRAEAGRVLAALEAGQTVADVPPELAPLLRASVQPYLISWMALDPVAELARVAAPVLIVQGTTDLQVGVADARRLVAGRAGVSQPTTLVLVEGMNHILRQAPLEREANFATYSDPGLPLSPGLIEPIAAFLLR